MDFTWDYTCPYCGNRIKNLHKECLIDLTGIIAERIETEANLDYKFRLRERLKGEDRFCVKVKKGIIPKRSIPVSFGKIEIEDRLQKLQNERATKNLETLIKRGAKEFHFEIQPEDTLKKGRKCFDSVSVFETEERVQPVGKAERCCPGCRAPLSKFAGRFKNKNVILIKNSLLDEKSLLKSLSTVINTADKTEEFGANKVDDNDELFAVRTFLLEGNNKHLLLNAIEIDTRVFTQSNNDFPENDRNRINSCLKIADYIWLPLRIEQEGFGSFNEAIRQRAKWLKKKRCLVRCISDHERKTHVKQNEVLELYRESCQAKKWISAHDKSGNVLEGLESVFLEKFYYFGKETTSGEKTIMALNWIKFLEGMREDQNNVYIGKTRGLLRTVFSKESENEYKLYNNLTQQTGFMI